MAVSLGYDGLIPYMYFDGSSYYIPPDAHGVILGTESYVPSAQRGLTLGCWVKKTATGSFQGLITKYHNSVATERSYVLDITSTEHGRLLVSQNGSAVEGKENTSSAMNTTDWYFVVGRWNTSGYAVWLDDTKETGATTLTSIYNSSAVLSFGGLNGSVTSSFTGYMAYPFICASSLSDATIEHLWQVSRSLFGK